MSIQDDIFDVQAALEGMPVTAATFDRIMKHYLAQEEEHDAMVLIIRKIQQGHLAMKALLGDDPPVGQG